ncbi:DUF2534 family protein [Apirhabdus apintestini]|nr:DUF2534 family protein [Enterobacteriaceae bacterium CA-0114]
MLKILRTAEGKKFLIAATIVFLIAATTIGIATFQGVVDEYNMPMQQWPLSLFIMQGLWVFIYTLIFTVIGSLPFGFYF